jgi:hypothetical protein
MTAAGGSIVLAALCESFAYEFAEQRYQVCLATSRVDVILGQDPVANGVNPSGSLDQGPREGAHRAQSMVNARSQVQDDYFIAQLAGDLVVGRDDSGFY